MKTLTFFFRHPHPIYFSIEKLFHTIAGRSAKMLSGEMQVAEKELPFTSGINTIRKNIRYAASVQTEINHVTGDAHYVILGCSKKNFNILTVHDCVLLYQYPRYSPRRQLLLWLWYRLPVKKADLVTVISENTKADLIRFTRCAPEKIRVIPNFIDPAFRPVPATFRKEKPVLLFIGTAANKNLDRVIDAMKGLDAELLIVGFPGGGQLEKIRSGKIDCRVLNGLSDEAMRETYAGADVLLFPSLHEGFGLPVLEAQVTGRAVITSNLEPMKSVAGEGACFVDPFSAASIREGIDLVIGNPSYREKLIANGFRNAERYRPEAIAGQYISLYRAAVKNKERN